MEIINPEKVLVRIAKILDDLGIEYYVTGGMAVSLWGRPRATFDIDLVINLREPEVAALAQALKSISQFGYMDEDIAREAIRERGEFNFVDPDAGAKVDFWIVPRDSTDALYRRKIVEVIDGQEVSFISPEDLIISKLVWHRMSQSERHLDDVRSVIAISGSKLDRKYLQSQAEKRGVADTLTTLYG